MGLVGIIYFCGRKHPVLYGHRAAASVSSPFYKPAWFHHDSIWLSRSHHFIWRAVGKSDCSKGQTWTFNLPFKSIHNDTEDLTFQKEMSAARLVTAMCKKAKSWLAFELRCKDRKEAKFCRLPLLSVQDVSHGSPRSPQIQSFHEDKVQMHFTLGRGLQDSPQPHSSSAFLSQDINDLLENMTGWAKWEVLS